MDLGNTLNGSSPFIKGQPESLFVRREVGGGGDKERLRVTALAAYELKNSGIELWDSNDQSDFSSRQGMFYGAKNVYANQFLKDELKAP